MTTPPGSEPPRRSRISVRFTQSELRILNEAATRAGYNISAYVRALLTGQRLPARSPLDRSLLARLLGQLGKIGSNLNQIARALNTRACGFEVMPGTERNLARILFELGQAKQELLGAMGRRRR